MGTRLADTLQPRRDGCGGFGVSGAGARSSGRAHPAACPCPPGPGGTPRGSALGPAPAWGWGLAGRPVGPGRGREPVPCRAAPSRAGAAGRGGDARGRHFPARRGFWGLSGAAAPSCARPRSAPAVPAARPRAMDEHFQPVSERCPGTGCCPAVCPPRWLFVRPGVTAGRGGGGWG